MNIINEPRGSGKTTKLLYTSSVAKIPILTYRSKSKEGLKERAKELNLDIPEPIAYEEIKDVGLDCLSSYQDVLVDDAEYILSAALKGYTVKAAVFTKE